MECVDGCIGPWEEEDVCHDPALVLLVALLRLALDMMLAVPAALDAEAETDAEIDC